jgi:hypothetical protein
MLLIGGWLRRQRARNNSCAITIVGYHGNYAYRVVASIPEWVTCGRFPWKSPTGPCGLTFCEQMDLFLIFADLDCQFLNAEGFTYISTGNVGRESADLRTRVDI